MTLRNNYEETNLPHMRMMILPYMRMRRICQGREREYNAYSIVFFKAFRFRKLFRQKLFVVLLDIELGWLYAP